MTSTNTDGMLNYRQVAVLLGWDPYVFRKVWAETPDVPTPILRTAEEDPLWDADQVRAMMSTPVKPPPDLRQRAQTINWTDSEMIPAKIFATLHSPPIKLRSVFANLARKRSRLAAGHDVENGVPEPDRRVLGHPVWNPESIRDYLANRPGPGNHKTKEEGRKGYTGGRVPGTKVRRKKEEVPVG